MQRIILSKDNNLQMTLLVWLHYRDHWEVGIMLGGSKNNSMLSDKLVSCDTFVVLSSSTDNKEVSFPTKYNIYL